MYRDSTRYDIRTGNHVKDLTLLNRPLERTLLLDPCPSHFEGAQPENALEVPRWTGDPKDTYLLDIIPFLETLALTGTDAIPDVRSVVANYKGKDIPVTFTKHMELVQKMQQEEYERQKNAAQSGGELQQGWLGWAGQLVMSAFGLQRATVREILTD